MIFLADLDFY